MVCIVYSLSLSEYTSVHLMIWNSNADEKLDTLIPRMSPSDLKPSVILIHKIYEFIIGYMLRVCRPLTIRGSYCVAVRLRGAAVTRAKKGGACGTHLTLTVSRNISVTKIIQITQALASYPTWRYLIFTQALCSPTHPPTSYLSDMRSKTRHWQIIL